MAAVEEPEYFVLHGTRDDSFALVGRADVVYEPPAELEDEVRFSYGSRRSLHTGIIKAFGDDHDAMKRLMNRLNRDRIKRAASFDADKPRRAKVMGRDQISKLSSKSTKKPAAQLSSRDQSPQPASPKSSNASPVASECDLTDKNDSESSDDSDTALQDLKKICSKRRAMDVRAIRLGKENEAPKRSKKSRHRSSTPTTEAAGEQVKTPCRGTTALSPPTPPSKPLRTSPHPPHTGTAPTARRNILASSNNGNSSSTRDDHADHSEHFVEDMQRKRKRARRVKYTKAVFSGEFFRYREPSEDVLPLREGGSIFVHKRAMKLARKAKTPTSVARQLVKSVFSDKALLECSVTGRPSNSTRTGERVIRPALDADGVCEILDFVEHRCVKKGWGKMDETPVKRAMMDVMNEDRYFLYLQQCEQQQQGEQQQG